MSDKTYLFTETQLRAFIKRVLCNNDCPGIEEIALSFSQELDIDFFYEETMRSDMQVVKAGRL